jgi:hypothetical protein
MRLGPGMHLEGYKLLADIPPKDLITFTTRPQPTTRTDGRNGRACHDGFLGGMVIGLLPLPNFCCDRALSANVSCGSVSPGERFI